MEKTTMVDKEAADKKKAAYKVERVTGSTAEFDDDWRRLLASSDSRYLIYPTRDSGRQADLMD